MHFMVAVAARLGWSTEVLLMPFCMSAHQLHQYPAAQEVVG